MLSKSILKVAGVIGVGLASGWAIAGGDPTETPSYVFPIGTLIHWLSHLF